MRLIVSCPSFSLSFSLLLFWLSWDCLTMFNIMVCLFGHVATMCPKLKHLKHFGFEVLVSDLGVEGSRVETFWEEVVCFEKLEGEFCVEILLASFLEELEVDGKFMELFSESCEKWCGSYGDLEGA